jgi:hypothetical protein
VGTEQAVRPHRLRLGLPRIRVLVGHAFEVEPQRPTIAAARELTLRVDRTIQELRRPYGELRYAWID